MVIHSPGRWQIHYSGTGMGMIFPRYQNWRTSQLPFSISLANRVNTGVSFDTPSGGIAERARWARRGMQGWGPRLQYPGAGMDGMGHYHHDCGCGCGGAGTCGSSGLGLFDSGLDYTGWGFPEFAIVIGVGMFALYSMFSTTKRGVKSGYLGLEGAAQRRRKRRAARYRAKAKRLEEKGLGGIFA